MRKQRVLFLSLLALSLFGLAACNTSGAKPRESLPVPEAHQIENQGGSGGGESEKGRPAPSAPQQQYYGEESKGR